MKKYLWSIVTIVRAVRLIRQRASAVRPVAAIFVRRRARAGRRRTGSFAQSSQSAIAKGQSDGCAADGGIPLPPGFCATVFADKLGHARHMVVAADGVVYVNTWSGAYYRNAAAAGRVRDCAQGYQG